MAIQTYSILSTGGFAASSSGANFQIGFRPRLVDITNLGSVSLWAKFDTTSSGSTGDLHISSCSSVNRLTLDFGDRTPVNGNITFFATSTTAGLLAIVAVG